MKKKMFPVLGFLVCIILSCGNDSVKTVTDTPQSNNYIVSLEGIDSMKLEMTTPQLEKLLKTKIVFRHIGKDYSPDTVNVKYKGMDMILFMDGSDDSTATLRAIQTTNVACKTATGVGTGSDKLKVIDSYPDNTKYVGPVYEEYPVRSTTKSVVAVMDTMAYRAIVFHIINRKVVSVEVSSFYEYY